MRVSWQTDCNCPQNTRDPEGLGAESSRKPDQEQNTPGGHTCVGSDKCCTNAIEEKTSSANHIQSRSNISQKFNIEPSKFVQVDYSTVISKTGPNIRNFSTVTVYFDAVSFTHYWTIKYSTSWVLQRPGSGRKGTRPMHKFRWIDHAEMKSERSSQWISMCSQQP